MSTWNADVYRTYSPSEPHWRLCREFIDRYRHLLPEEQVVALALSFASSQLQMRGKADQTRWLVWDQLLLKSETLPCWEREAEPEFPPSSVVLVAEEGIRNEPEEVVEISDDDDDDASNTQTSKISLSSEIAQLTHFKPVETFQKAEEIYRSLVILDNDFDKTQHEFDKLGLGRLLVTDRNCDVGRCRAVVSVRTSEKQFTMVEAFGSTLKKAKQNVRKAFLKELKPVCFQIVSKNPFNLSANYIKRRGSPATNLEHYWCILEMFSKQPIKQDLTVSKEFSPAERDILTRIAHELNLTTCVVGPQKKQRLKIVGRSTPALAVLERIVVQKDPELCELYDVILPRARVKFHHPSPFEIPAAATIAMSSWNPDAYRAMSLSECHWKLCREFMERYRNLFPEQQTVALAQIFANTQLLLRGDADQTARLVLDLAKNEPSVKVKREIERIENGMVKKAASGDVPPEVIVEKELIVKTEQPAESDRDEAEELSSAHEDSMMENCSSNSPPKAKKSRKEAPESDATFLAQLTLFKHVKTLASFEDVYRNLVIVDSDFEKTCAEFKRLGSGLIQMTQQTWDEDHCSSKISVDQILLVEAWSKTEKLARKKALAAFFKKMKVFCYQIVSSKPSHHVENQIARQEDPAENIKHYKSIVKRFARESIAQELVFSEDFSEEERDKLQRIAIKLNLETCIVGPPTNPQLKIIGRPIPALAIVERIVVANDPKLSELYEVIPPSVGTRGEIGDSS